MKYLVQVREVHISHREIEAESAEQALSFVADQDGEETFLEYSHTLDPDLWTVEEVK